MVVMMMLLLLMRELLQLVGLLQKVRMMVIVLRLCW